MPFYKDVDVEVISFGEWYGKRGYVVEIEDASIIVNIDGQLISFDPEELIMI